jgi:ABC-type transporter Mla subunit MlaD
MAGIEINTRPRSLNDIRNAARMCAHAALPAISDLLAMADFAAPRITETLRKAGVPGVPAADHAEKLHKKISELAAALDEVGSRAQELIEQADEVKAAHNKTPQGMRLDFTLNA